MASIQETVFDWIASQSPLTGIAVFVGGLVFAFFGYRLFRLALAMTCFAAGCGIGAIVSKVAGLPPLPSVLVAGTALGGASIYWYRLFVPLGCGVTWGALGCLVAQQVDLSTDAALIAGAVSGLLGVLFAWLCTNTMVVVLTALQGAMAMVVGFVGFTTDLAPTIGVTFRQWSAGEGLLVPILLAMVFTTGYSYQAIQAHGDILSGAGRAVRET